MESLNIVKRQSTNFYLSCPLFYKFLLVFTNFSSEFVYKYTYIYCVFDQRRILKFNQKKGTLEKREWFFTPKLVWYFVNIFIISKQKKWKSEWRSLTCTQQVERKREKIKFMNFYIVSHRQTDKTPSKIYFNFIILIFFSLLLLTPLLLYICCDVVLLSIL